MNWTAKHADLVMPGTTPGSHYIRLASHPTWDIHVAFRPVVVRINSVGILFGGTLRVAYDWAYSSLGKETGPVTTLSPVAAVTNLRKAFKSDINWRTVLPTRLSTLTGSPVGIASEWDGPEFIANFRVDITADVFLKDIQKHLEFEMPNRDAVLAALIDAWSEKLPELFPGVPGSVTDVAELPPSNVVAFIPKAVPGKLDS